MGPNSKQASAQMNSKLLSKSNKTTHITRTRLILEKNLCAYAAFRYHDDQVDIADQYSEPTTASKNAAAKLVMRRKLGQFEGNPEKADIDLQIKADEALCKHLIIEGLADEDVMECNNKDVVNTWKYVLEYGNAGAAKRLANLDKKMRTTMYSESENMEQYLKIMRDFYHKVTNIKKSHITEMQFMTVTLTNLGVEHTTAGGAFTYVAQDLRQKVMDDTAEWTSVVADLMDAELNLKPEQSSAKDAASDDTTTALMAEVQKLSKKLNKVEQHARRPSQPSKKASVECHNCHKMGHYASECRSNKQRGLPRNDRDQRPRRRDDSRSPSRRKRQERKRRRSVSSDEEAMLARAGKGRRHHRRRSTSWGSDEASFVTTSGQQANNLCYTLTAMVASAVLVCIGLASVIVDASDFNFPASMTSIFPVFVTAAGAICIFFGLSCPPTSFTTVTVSDVVLATLSKTMSFVVDSGATTHVVCCPKLAARMTNIHRGKWYIFMNSHKEKIEYKGDLRIKVLCRQSNKSRWITLKDVAFVPTSNYNLFSETAYLDGRSKGASVCHTANSVYIQDHNGWKLFGARVDNLYKFELDETALISEQPESNALGSGPSTGVRFPWGHFSWTNLSAAAGTPSDSE